MARVDKMLSARKTCVSLLKIHRSGPLGAFHNLLLLATLILLLQPLLGCARPLYVPGASQGYFLWQTSEVSYHIRWSKKEGDHVFTGRISTDGQFGQHQLVDWEPDDALQAKGSEITFSGVLKEDDDDQDGFDFTLSSGTYLEFDLKIDNEYYPTSVYLAELPNTATSKIFRIEKNYLLDHARLPFYKKHPFNVFLQKLAADRIFTTLYLLLLGVLFLELTRITLLSRRKDRGRILLSLYLLLLALLAGINLVLSRLQF